eukprot:GILK01004894.1.p1 GENE.GILK01004894.1~~GILK01004894.1.p1  ORF type:complete len:854 (+),score=139.34 GILK01004894.1:105-2666(+)
MVNIKIQNDDIVILIMDFMKQQQLYGSLLALEHETNVCLERYGKETAFCRSLVLDGQWEDAENFLKPLQNRPGFDFKKVLFEIRKQRFLELLDNQSLSPAVTELVDGLKDLEDKCSKEEFNGLCYCLTLERLTDHPDYKTWTPQKGRLLAFEKIRPFLVHIYPDERSRQQASDSMEPNRLVSLLKQALLYQFSAYKNSRGDHEIEDGDSDLTITLLNDIDRQLHNSTNGKALNSAGSNPGSERINIAFESRPVPARAGNVMSEKEYMRSSMAALPSRRSEVGSSLNHNGVTSATIIPTRMADPTSDSTGSVSKNNRSVSSQAQRREMLRSSMVAAIPSVHFPDQLYEDRSEMPNAASRSRQSNSQPASTVNRPSSATARHQRPSTLNQDLDIGPDPIQGPSSHRISRESVPTRSDGNRLSMNRQSQNWMPTNEQQQQKEESKHVSAVNLSENRPAVAAHNDKEFTFNAAQRQKLRDTESELIQSSAVKIRQPPVKQISEQRASTNFSHLVPESLHVVGTLTDVQAIRSVCFAPSGSHFAVGTNSKVLRICALEQFTSRVKSHADEEETDGYSDMADEGVTTDIPVVLEKQRVHLGSIYCVAWNASGSVIATGSNDKTIKLIPIGAIDLKNPPFSQSYIDQHLKETALIGHTSTVRALDFSSTTDRLFSGGADNVVNIWDIERAQNITSLTGHSGPVYCLQVSQDGNRFVTGAHDRTVRIWDVRSCATVLTIPNLHAAVNSVAISPSNAYSSGQLLAAAHEDGPVTIFDMTAGKIVTQFTHHQQDCRSVDFSANGRWLVTSSFDGTVGVVDVWTRRSATSLQAHQDRVISAKWHPKIPLIISTSADRTVRVWVP